MKLIRDMIAGEYICGRHGERQEIEDCKYCEKVHFDCKKTRIDQEDIDEAQLRNLIHWRKHGRNLRRGES